MKRPQSAVIVMALALSLLTACGSDSDKANNNASNSNGSGSSNAGAEADQSNNGSRNIGVDQPDPSKALFSKQFSLPGKTQNKVTVGILSLKRQDQVLMLKVVVTPVFADKSAGETISFTDALGEPSSWNPTLLDLKNLKKYSVLSGGERLSFSDGKAVSGQPIYGWAAFAPPPAGVTSIDLTMVSWMPRFTNVPIN